MTNLTGKPEVFCLTFLTLTLHYLGLPWKFPSMEHYLFFFFSLHLHAWATGCG